MLHTTKDSDAYAWFANFRDDLHASLAGGSVSHIRPIHDDLQPVTFGWFTRVACLKTNPRIFIEVWFNTYLGATGPYHLGCWYEDSWTKVKKLIEPLSSAWGLSISEYGDSDRGHDQVERLLPHVGRREASRIPAPLIDRWGHWAYAGLYAVRDPQRCQRQRQVLDDCVDALRRLVDVLRVANDEVRPQKSQDLTEVEERQRRLAWVLSRDGQKTARRLAFQQFEACLISGESVPEALEAAHIQPVYAKGSDSPENILLLRADIHRLFDAGLLTICQDPKPCVKIARGLIRSNSSYPALATLDMLKVSDAQWLALATRNSCWDDDLGLTHIKQLP